MFFYVFAGYFYCDMEPIIAKPGHRRTHSAFIYHEKDVLFLNIVGAECIVCTHWRYIVGAAAPTSPMVPTPMHQRESKQRSET